MPNTVASTDNANVVAPAPVFYAAALVLGLIVDYFYTAPILSNRNALIAGCVLLIVSIPIALLAVLELRKAGTAFDARKTSTALVTQGIFRFSRNPTYLSLTMLFAAIALILNSMVVLIAVVIATVLTHLGVVRREEKYMSAKFSSAYSEYKDKVRPWI